MCNTKFIFSEFFNLGRGCRQGNPISSYLFLIYADIMGNKKNKPLIKDIYTVGKEFQLLQFANDTVLLLDGSEHFLKSAFFLVDQSSKFSGLKPNHEKTQCIQIGSLRCNSILPDEFVS